MMMAESTAARPVVKHGSAGKLVQSGNVSLTEAQSSTNQAGAYHSEKAAILAAYVATTKACLPAAAIYGGLNAAAKQQVEPPKSHLADPNGNKEETALLGAAQEKLRQQRQLELLERQQELGRKLLLLQEEQRQRDEADFAGANERCGWRWITSAASDAASEDDVEFSEPHTSAFPSSGTPHAYSSCCTTDPGNFKREWNPPDYSLGGLQYKRQTSRFTSAAPDHISSHTATRCEEKRTAVQLHSETPQSEQQVYVDFDVPSPRFPGQALAPVGISGSTVTYTKLPAAVTAPGADRSSGLSFPHVLWQEDEDLEGDADMPAHQESVAGPKCAEAIGTQQPPERAPPAMTVSASRCTTTDIQPRSQICYPFPEAAVLWESSSSCCSDHDAGLFSIGDEQDHRVQQLAPHRAKVEQQKRMHQQKRQLQSVLKPADLSVTTASILCSGNATTQVKQSRSSSFSPLQAKMRDVTVASKNPSWEEKATPSSTTRPGSVAPEQSLDATSVSVGCRRSYSDGRTGEKKNNADNKYACETPAAPVLDEYRSSSAEGADPGAADLSTAAVSSWASTTVVPPVQQKLCVANDGTTASGGHAIPHSRSSPVSCGAADPLSTPKILELLKGHRVLPPSATGEASLLQRPTTATSSPRAIVPLHRHWVQQLLLQHKKHQQRVQRLQQQQRHRQQRQVQSAPAQHHQQQVRQQQVQRGGQQHAAREQHGQQPQGRDRLLSQAKLPKHGGERDQSVTHKKLPKAKNPPTAPGEASKNFRGSGKTSATERRPLAAGATSHSAGPSAPSSDAFTVAAPVVAAAVACDPSGGPPVRASSVPSTNTAAAAAPPAAVTRTPKPLGTAAASDVVPCPAGAPAAIAEGTCELPSSGTKMSLVGCHDDASFAFTALADVLCRNAAAGLLSSKPPISETYRSFIPPSSSVDASSATVPGSVSKAPPLPRPPDCSQSLSRPTTTNESCFQVHVATSAAPATTIFHDNERKHALDERLRLSKTPHTLPPAGGASGPKKSVIPPVAAATGENCLPASAAYTQLTDNPSQAIKPAKEKKNRVRCPVDAEALDPSTLSSSYVFVNDNGGGLHQSAPVRRRSNASVARAAVVTAQQPTDLLRKRAPTDAAARGGTVSRASGACKVPAMSAAAASASTGAASRLVAAREEALAVSVPAGGYRGQTEACPRKNRICKEMSGRTSNSSQRSSGLTGGEEEQSNRILSVSSRLSGSGSHVKSQSGEPVNASKTAQSVDEQQQQSDVLTGRRRVGELVVEGVHVTKQKGPSSMKEAQQRQQQQWVVDQGLQMETAKENEEILGGQSKQQQIPEETDTDLYDTLKIQTTLQKLRKRLLLDKSEAGNEIKTEQHGTDTMCVVGVSNHHEKSCSSKQLQSLHGRCSNRRQASRCGEASEKKTGSDMDSRLSNSSNDLSHSVAYSRTKNKVTAHGRKDDRDTRETPAAASAETRGIIKDGNPVSRGTPVGWAESARTAWKDSNRDLSVVAGSRNRSRQRLTTNAESTTAQQTVGQHIEEQRVPLQKLLPNKRKETIKRKEISSCVNRLPRVFPAGTGGDAGITSDMSCVPGGSCIRERSSSGSRQSSRSRCSSSSSSRCTPSTILRRLRRLLEKDSSPSCLSPKYEMGRLNRRQKSDRQKRGSRGSSTCSSMTIERKNRSVRTRKKTDYCRKSSTRRDRCDSRTSELGSTSLADLSSHTRGGSTESSGRRIITKASRKMWKKLVAKSRRQLLAGSSKAGSIEYSTSVSSSGSCRRGDTHSNTDSRREMSRCSEGSSRSSEASSCSSEGSSTDSEVSSNSSEVSSSHNSIMTSSSDFYNKLLRQVNFKGSENNFLDSSLFTRRSRREMKKINPRAARCYRPGTAGISACRDDNPAGAGVRLGTDAAESLQPAFAAEAPAASRPTLNANEPAPSLISLWLQYSAAALEDTEPQQQRVPPSPNSPQQAFEGMLWGSGMLSQQKVGTKSSNSPRGRKKNSRKKRGDSRDNCSDSNGSSRGRSSRNALEHTNSSEEASNSDSISSDTTHSSRCSPSANDTGHSLDPDAIIRRIKRRLRLPVFPLKEKKTERQRPQNFSKPSHNSCASISAETSKKKRSANDAQSRPQLEGQSCHRELQQEHQQEEPEHQKDRGRAQDKSEVCENRSVGSHEQKGDAPEREQHTSETKSTPGQEPMPEPGHPVTPMQQERKQRCTESTREHAQTGASAVIPDDDPSGPLHLSALGYHTVASSEKRQEASTCRQREEEVEHVQQQHEEERKQENVFCEEEEEQRLQPLKQQEHEPQELERHQLKQDEQCNSLFCPTAATANEDALPDTKEAVVHETAQELDSSISVVESVENVRPDAVPHTQRKYALPHALSTVAQTVENPFTGEDRRTSAGDSAPFQNKRVEPDHRDDAANCICALDAMRAQEISSGHLLHAETARQTVEAHTQGQEEALEGQAEIQGQQQKADEPRKYEEMMYHQQVLQSPQRQAQPICQERQQQATPCAVVEEARGEANRNLRNLQSEADSKSQLLPNGGNHPELIPEEQQSSLIERTHSVALAASDAGGEACVLSELVGADEALSDTETGGLSSTVPNVFSARSESSYDTGAVATANLRTSTSPVRAPEVATVLAAAAGVETCARVHSVTAVAEGGCRATVLPAAAAASTDEDATDAVDKSTHGVGARPTTAKPVATLVRSNCEHQATVVPAGGRFARYTVAVAASGGDMATVNSASSTGSFTFSLSSSSGSSSAADSPSRTKLKQSSDSSGLGQSNSSNRTINSNAADGSCCFHKNANNTRLYIEGETNLNNETPRSPGGEVHTSSERPPRKLSSQLTTVPGLRSLTSPGPNDGLTAAKKADTARVAETVEAKKAPTSAGILPLAVACICESPCASVEAEVGSGSNNGVGLPDTKPAATANSERPPSAGCEETESEQRMLNRDSRVNARESVISAAHMQQASRRSQPTSSKPQIDERNPCHEDLSPSTNKGEAESIFSNACAADAPSHGSGALADGPLALLGDKCPAAQSHTRANTAFPAQECGVGRRVSVRSPIEGMPTSLSKEQQSHQLEGLVVSRELVLTREAPPQEVLDIVMQQQQMLQTQTKHLCLSVNRASCDSIPSSVSEGNNWCLPSPLSETGSYKPASPHITRLEEVPEWHADHQRSCQSQQKQRECRKERKSGLQRKQQPAPRDRRRCASVTGPPDVTAAGDRAALDTSEEEKVHGESERVVQILNMIVDKHNRAGKVLARGGIGKYSTVEHLGSGDDATVPSNAAFPVEGGIIAACRPFLAALADTRRRIKEPEFADSVSPAKRCTGILPDAVLASAATILHAAYSNEGRSFLGSLKGLEELLRTQKDFSRRERIGVPAEPFGPPSSSLLKAAGHCSKQEHLQAKAKKCGVTSTKKTNHEPLPTAGGTHIRRTATIPAEAHTSRERHKSKRAFLAERRCARAAATHKMKEEASSRCHCLGTTQHGAVTTALAVGEAMREQQTGVTRRHATRQISSGSTSSSHFQTQGNSPVAAVVNALSKPQSRREHHVREGPGRISCRRRSKGVDKCRRRDINRSRSSSVYNCLQQSISKGETSQRNVSLNAERTYEKSFHNDPDASETQPRVGCRNIMETDGKSRKAKKCRRARYCFRSRSASGYDSGHHKRNAYDSDSRSSSSGGSCWCHSEYEGHSVEEGAAPAKPPHRLDPETPNKEYNESLRGPRSPAQQRLGRQRQHHRQQERRHDRKQADTDVAETRPAGTERHFRDLSGGRLEQRSTHDLLPQQRRMAWSNAREPCDTLVEDMAHQQMSKSVSASPVSEGKKIHDSHFSREQQLLQAMKQETAQLPQGQTEGENPTRQPDFAWCWREWGGCEIYEQQRNRLQAVLREALEGLA